MAFRSPADCPKLRGSRPMTSPPRPDPSLMRVATPPLLPGPTSPEHSSRPCAHPTSRSWPDLNVEPEKASASFWKARPISIALSASSTASATTTFAGWILAADLQTANQLTASIEKVDFPDWKGEETAAEGNVLDVRTKAEFDEGHLPESAPPALHAAPRAQGRAADPTRGNPLRALRLRTTRRPRHGLPSAGRLESRACRWRLRSLPSASLRRKAWAH